jgi:hypothetical protein
MEIRVTTVVMPRVRPRMRKRTLPFRLRRLLMEMSLSLTAYHDSLCFPIDPGSYPELVEEQALCPASMFSI